MYGNTYIELYRVKHLNAKIFVYFRIYRTFRFIISNFLKQK